MKKLFTICFCLLLSGTLSAQEFFIGAQVIPQQSWLLNQDDADLPESQYKQEFLGGVAAGIKGGYRLGKIRLETGLLYSQEGGRYSLENASGERYDQTTRLEYLKVPLIVGFLPTELERKWNAFVGAGVQMDYLVRAYTYNDNTDYQPPVPDNYLNYPSTREAFAPIGLRGVGQVGVDVKLTYELSMNMYLRVDYLFSDVEDKEESFVIVEDGESREQLFWPYVRGAERTASTHPISMGLVIGLNYAFGQ
ncbi:MAG: outer membrane beta-barrel protein [Bacteroidota bacterium]